MPGNVLALLQENVHFSNDNEPRFKMKIFVALLLIFSLFSCNQQAGKVQELQNRVDSLEQKLSESYKPGFGEFMMNIQAHHSKLWFAGQNENWELAKFEIDEIKESFDDILKFETDRTETKLVPMINPSIDSVNLAILKKDLKSFKSNFVFLTSTCNACHVASGHKFNLVRIPESSPFSNQDFKIQN
jgi:hypothetical protein